MNCHFNESVFLPLGREKSALEEQREITWNASMMSHFDYHINQYELEVQRIIHFPNLTNQLLNAFIGTKKVTKSHILNSNAPAQIDVPKGWLENESKICLMCGRPIGS